MAGLRFNHVKKQYNSDTFTVKDFHLDVPDKEFLVLVGPSGCGKSTTLRMIAGLEDISEGEIYIDDQLVNGIESKDRDIAMVFQNYALYPHMSVYENIAFGLKLRDITKKEIDRKVREISRVLDLEHLLNRKPKALSGGQRQRVALGRAIVREPKVFLMDEPLSNLDAKLRVQMRLEISKLHKRLKTTIVYVTHDQTEAMTMGDRIVVMYNGIIQQQATPEIIYNCPDNKFVAGFIGSPAMNFINGKVIEDNGEILFENDMLSFPIPEQKGRQIHQKGYVGKWVTFGIRPEDIHDETESLDDMPKAHFNTTIDATENLGAETYLYLEESIVARVKGVGTEEPGKKIKLVMNLNKCHFFDIETEKSIID